MSRIRPTPDELIAAWEKMLKALPNYSLLVDENRHQELFNTRPNMENFNLASNGVGYVDIDGDVSLVRIYFSFTIDNYLNWQFQKFDAELDKIKRVLLDLFPRPIGMEVFIGKTKVQSVSVGNTLDFMAKIIVNKDINAVPRQQD